MLNKMSYAFLIFLSVPQLQAKPEISMKCMKLLDQIYLENCPPKKTDPQTLNQDDADLKRLNNIKYVKIENSKVSAACTMNNQSKTLVTFSATQAPNGECRLESIEEQGVGLIYDHKICTQAFKVKEPFEGSQAKCQVDAKKFLKEKKLKEMAESYEAYLALAQDEPSQKSCHKFIKDVIDSQLEGELSSATELYGKDRANSLERVLTTFKHCTYAKEKYTGSTEPIKVRKAQKKASAQR